jgi:ribosomal protein S18 acetylase RimI-like enzyme
MTERAYLRMRRHLGPTVPVPVWPDGMHLKAFTESEAAEVHALLKLAYANGGGSVPSIGEWWSVLSQDSEYDPSLCFLVRDRRGALVGFAQCWTTAFVKDFVVHPDHRRRGIGQALLLHIFHVFRDRGAERVDLKVQTNNLSGAIPFYESLGMLQIAD